jgi:hypothetical protein
MNKGIVMDILNFEFTDVDINTPRDLVFGPQVVHSIGYGVSLTLPKGWMAASVLGELYGIEPRSRSDGRIYVTGKVAGIADVIRSHAETLDLGFVKLLPTSTPFVDHNQVSIHGSVQGVGVHKHAYVATAVTKNNKAITFAALFDESSALMFRSVVSEIADSVEDIAAYH